MDTKTENKPDAIKEYWRVKQSVYYSKNKDALNAKRRLKYAEKTKPIISSVSI